MLKMSCFTKKQNQVVAQWSKYAKYSNNLEFFIQLNLNFNLQLLSQNA
jgi:hypothetical protein